MKLSNVLDDVKAEVVARVRSVEDSASYGVTEIMATRYRVNTEDGTFVVVRIPEHRRFLEDPMGYLLQAEWSSREGFPLEISVNQDEIVLKPCSTA